MKLPATAFADILVQLKFTLLAVAHTGLAAEDALVLLNDLDI